MMNYQRYALYFTAEGALAEHGAAWLGWDIATGTARAHPDVPGFDVDAITRVPRKYGFHGTIKPPFALAEGCTAQDLLQESRAVISRLPRVQLDGLKVTRLGRFLALTPDGPSEALADVAAAVVQGLDRFRAPASEAELARRRKSGLSPAQENNLLRWGYPYVLDEFRFHMTLTGPLEDAEALHEPLTAHFTDVLPRPFHVNRMTFCGQRADGMFEAIENIPLEESTASS